MWQCLQSYSLLSKRNPVNEPYSLPDNKSHIIQKLWYKQKIAFQSFQIQVRFCLHIFWKFIYDFNFIFLNIHLIRIIFCVFCCFVVTLVDNWVVFKLYCSSTNSDKMYLIIFVTNFQIHSLDNLDLRQT